MEMRHMWGMTELSPIGSVAGFKVNIPSSFFMSLGSWRTYCFGRRTLPFVRRR